MRHVLFRLGRAVYGLPLSAIREVVTAPTETTRVPRAPKAVPGVFNLRGRVVPLVDLPLLLGVDLPDHKAAKVLLLDLSRRELGLLVTDVEGIEVLDKVPPAQGKSSPLVKGVGRLGARAITVLDVEALDQAVAAAFD